MLRRGAFDIGREGWDQDTGWGLVNVPNSLQVADPPIDALEPNDDIPFVDGTFFESPDRAVYSGKNRRLSAQVDFAEDPHDVYRIRMPSRSALRATLRPRYGDPDLFAYDDRARSVFRRRGLVSASVRRRGPDRVFLVNSARRQVSGYLVVRAPGSGSSIDSRYSLTITRTR